MLQLRDQMAELAAQNGLKVSDAIQSQVLQNQGVVEGEIALLPTIRAQNGEDRNNKIYARDISKPQNLENALAVTLIPTPTARDHKDGSQPHVRNGEMQADTLGRLLALLPTPNTMDGLPARSAEQKAANKGKGGYANLRGTVVNDLLPTTRVSMANGATKREIEEGNPKKRLEAVTNWAKFQPAIERWEEVVGRPAPLPTRPDGKDGNHRLNPEFAEWLMGLSEGWVTGVGLTRNEELRACGNGVVPQQAELALRILLEGVDYASN